jgi:SAM-dependent methyltransferase
VLEIGCGPLGGFVPKLRASGYDAVGIDPAAPEGAEYVRVAFELAEPPGEVDAVVASTSLHHVADPGEVVDHLASVLAVAGTVVVVEWDQEAFDEPTAEWCFERLGPDTEPGWLHRRRDEWAASGQPWSTYLREWAQEHGLRSAGTLLRLLDARFARQHLEYGPYFFPDLAATTEGDERAAIEAGRIRATRLDYVGTLQEGERPGIRGGTPAGPPGGG